MQNSAKAIRLTAMIKGTVERQLREQFPADDRLSKAASMILLSRRCTEEAMDADSKFDGGEWSIPALARAEEDYIVEALADLGFTVDSYNVAITARTSARFAHFYGLLA